MIRRIEFSGKPPGNPLLNALVIAGGALAFAALVLFSIVAFLVVTSLVALLALVVGLRVWWRSRRWRAHGAGQPAPPGGVIEGEYRHVPSRGENERQGR